MKKITKKYIKAYRLINYYSDKEGYDKKDSD